MLEILMNVGEIISPIFYRLLYMSIIGTILGTLILILTKLFDNKLSAKWKALMWIIPLIFLMIPIQRIEIKIPNNIPISSTIDKVENIFNSVEPIEYKELAEGTYKSTEQQTTQLEEIQNNENPKYDTKEIILNMLIPLLWLIVSTIGLFIFIIGNISLIIKVSKTKKVRDYRIKSIQRSCKRKLKINKNIEIRSQKVNTSPCIYGIMHPKILVPEGFTEKEDEIIENVFMHELSHYKRKDMITNFILIIITSLHWFNPFVYMLFKRIRQEMELATDEIALSKMDKDEKKKYGLTLINLLQTYQCEQLATKMLCIVDDNKSMEKRIKMIKLSTKLKKHRTSIIIFILAILLCMISPFLLKTSSGINANQILEDENLYEQEGEKLVNQTKLENEAKEYYKYFDINSNSEDNTMINGEYIDLKSNKEEINKLLGRWKPYMAEYNGKEIPLSSVYGSGIVYGGELILNDDGTYTEFIGVYSEDIKNDLQGTYKIYENGEKALLTSNNGESKVLKCLEISNINSNEGTMVERLEDGTYVYFEKQ